MNAEAQAAGAESILAPGRNCWRIERAHRVAWLVDGDAYFRAFREAVKKATRSIFVVGWDVDSRMRLARDHADDGWPAELGDFLNAIVAARRGLDAYVLDWDFAMLYALDREVLPIYKLDWSTHRRLHFRLDGEHPVGASHHQKIVVIDDALAFVGGLDLTKGRWDTPHHRPEEPLRVDPEGEPYPPFHDVQLMVDGAAARALGELARDRWERATGRRPEGGETRQSDPWPESLEPHFRDVEVAIARTEAEYDGHPQVEEVKALYLDSIAAARDSVYIENQYFTSAATGEAIARRLEEGDGPEIVVVSRLEGSGWLETHTMTVLRARLLERLHEADRQGRFRVYYPDIAGLGAPVKLHTKLMIVDDRLLRVGSSNLNNRSMGFDSECDLALECDAPAGREKISELRDRLLAEHLGTEPARVAEAIAAHGSLVGAIESLRGGPRTLSGLAPDIPPEMDALVPEADLIDPERPVDPDELADGIVPEEGRERAGGRIIAWASIVVGIAGLAAAWRWTPLSDWLSPEALSLYAEQIQVSRTAPVWVLGAYLVASLVAFPITVLIVATAIVFGPWTALAYALSGVLGGAAIGFGLGHALGRDAVRNLAGEWINRLSRRLAKRGLLTIVAVRIVPVAPFTVVNLVAGASHIRFRDFALGTLLGMAPGIAAVTIFSDRVAAVIRDPSPSSIAVLVLVAVAIAAVA
ncbi:MAG: hypothetical protein RLZZ565_163, partial [Planctomycetota bacterium]